MNKKSTIGTKAYFDDIVKNTIFKGDKLSGTVFSDSLKKLCAKAADATEQIYEDVSKNTKYIKWLADVFQSNLQNIANSYYNMSQITKASCRKTAKDVERMISVYKLPSNVSLNDIKSASNFMLKNRMKYNRQKICKLVQDVLDRKSLRMDADSSKFIADLQKYYKNNIISLALEYIEYQNNNNANKGKNGKEIGAGQYNSDIFRKFLGNVSSLNYTMNFGTIIQKQLDNIAEQISKDIREAAGKRDYLELGLLDVMTSLLKDLGKYTNKIRLSEMERLLKLMDADDKIKAINKFISENKDRYYDAGHAVADKRDDGLYHFFEGIPKEASITLSGLDGFLGVIPVPGINKIPFISDGIEFLAIKGIGGEKIGDIIDNDAADWGLLAGSYAGDIPKSGKQIGKASTAAGVIGSGKSIWEEATTDTYLVNLIVNRSFGLKLKSQTADGLKMKYAVYSIFVRKMLEENVFSFTENGGNIRYTWTHECSNVYDGIVRQSGIDIEFMEEYYS